MPDQIIIKRAHRGGRGPDKKKRVMNERSMKNLKPPIQSGQVLNPKGNNGRSRLYTDEYELIGTSQTPEPVRLILNIKLHLQLKQVRDAARAAELPAPLVKALEAQMKKELIPKGMLWAKVCSLRMHMNAVLEGDVSAMTEVRESVEGRAEQRIVVENKNSRLQQLLDAFENERQNPPPAPKPESA